VPQDIDLCGMCHVLYLSCCFLFDIPPDEDVEGKLKSRSHYITVVYFQINILFVFIKVIYS
jgi:hypothetical protein